MTVVSRILTYLDPITGGLVAEETDAQIFGFGTAASRPVSGSVAGDIYVVLDTGLGIFRFDLWDGSAWQATPTPGSSPADHRS